MSVGRLSVLDHGVNDILSEAILTLVTALDQNLQ